MVNASFVEILAENDSFAMISMWNRRKTAKFYRAIRIRSTVGQAVGPVYGVRR